MGEVLYTIEEKGTRLPYNQPFKRRSRDSEIPLRCISESLERRLTKCYTKAYGRAPNYLEYNDKMLSQQFFSTGLTENQIIIFK